MKIGYGKIGRSWNLNPEKWSGVGGDADVWRTLYTLARRRPHDEFILIGRNSGDDPAAVGLPPNVTNPWAGPLYDEMPSLKELHEFEGGKGKAGSYTLAAADAFVSKCDAVTGAMFEEVDHIIVWAGQHGTTSSPLPNIGSPTWANRTNPQVSQLAYTSYFLRGINRWRSKVDGQREEIWLCPDPRNYLKCRDLKWPMRYPVLAQYEMQRNIKHERYGDPRTPDELGFKAKAEDTLWVAKLDYAYSGLELTALDDPSMIECTYDFHTRSDFGMIINENRKGGKKSRLPVMQEWVMPFWPDADIHGTWAQDSQEALGREISPISPLEVYDTMRKWKTTLTTPASSSGWATAKPWEAFAVGTICFFHPEYDVQGHIIPNSTKRDSRWTAEDRVLSDWLRLKKPSDLMKRVTALARDIDAWNYIVSAQRNLFERRYAEGMIYKMIDERIDGVQRLA